MKKIDVVDFFANNKNELNDLQTYFKIKEKNHSF
jgi:hypothetical protein